MRRAAPACGGLSMNFLIQINDPVLMAGHSAIMSRSFDAFSLSGEFVPQALPLIRATWPSIDMTTWQRFVQFFSGEGAAQGSGVLGLRDSGCCLCGVLAYRTDLDLQSGLVLAIQLFTAADLANSLGTIRALLEAAELQALELGCTSLQIRLLSGQAGLASRLRSLGLYYDTGLLRMEIDSRRARN